MTMTGALPPALPDSERQSGADLAEALRGVRIVWLHGCVPRNPLRASRHHAVEKPVWRAAKRTGALEAQSEGEKSVHLGEMTRVRDKRIGPLHTRLLRGDARNLSLAAEARSARMADALADNTILLPTGNPPTVASNAAGTMVNRYISQLCAETIFRNSEADFGAWNVPYGGLSD